MANEIGRNLTHVAKLLGNDTVHEYITVTKGFSANMVYKTAIY